MLATSFIKVLQKDGEQLTGKMGKIDAAALNKKDVQQVVRKITGGCLIIERAGDIDRSIAAQLSFLMEHDITGTLYILEDTSKGIKKALSMDEALHPSSRKRYRFLFLQMMNSYCLPNRTLQSLGTR